MKYHYFMDISQTPTCIFAIISANALSALLYPCVCLFVSLASAIFIYYITLYDGYLL